MAERPLDNQVAIVTGAGRGIGLAIASRLRDDGARVMFCDLEENVAREAAGEAEDTAWFAGDLSGDETARALVDATVQRFGTVDILINNAGGGILRPFLEHTPETLRTTVDRNLWTAVWCSYYALPVMKRAGRGRVVNIGADSVRNGLFDHAGYNAAKGGMHGMTSGLAREFARDGITVNTVAPCAVRSRQFDEVAKANPQLIEQCVSVIPMGRPAEEAEVASMVAYLCTADAAFVTGQVISVNGGSTML